MDNGWKNAETIAKKVVIFAILLGASCVAVYLLPRVLVLFMPFVTAYIISFIASPLTKLFDRIRFPRALSAVLAILLVAFVLFAVVGVIVYKIALEVYGFCLSAPDLYNRVLTAFEKVRVAADALPNLLPFDISGFMDDFGADIGSAVASVSSSVAGALTRVTLNSAKSIPAVLIGVVFSILASYFIISDKENIKSGVKKVLGQNLSKRISIVKNDLFSALFAYVRAQGILMCITFCELFAGLSILRVKYSFLIAILIAILDAIPVFGTGTVLLPWAVISLLTGSYGMAIGLLVLYGICLVVRQFLEPKIISVQIGVHPLITLMSMYVGYRLFGVFGMILAPVIALLVRNFVVRLKEDAQLEK